MPLYTIMIEDGNGVSLPIAHFGVAREIADILEKAFECFLQSNDVEMTKVFVIDKDFREQTLIKRYFKNAKIN